jgi:hypothetical protein
MCVVPGLFLALSLTWIIYPRIYEHYHPATPWPGEPEGFGFSNAGLSFWFGFSNGSVLRD